MTITSEQMDIPGIYNTETYGGALFHQSTYNNLFVKGFSITAGLRGDFEKVKLDYNTNTSLNINKKMGNMTRPDTLAGTLKGKASKPFSEVLPKVVLNMLGTNVNTSIAIYRVVTRQAASMYKCFLI